MDGNFDRDWEKHDKGKLNRIPCQYIDILTDVLEEPMTGLSLAIYYS